MSNPTGYSVVAYGDMINDEPRMPAYDAALRAAITPGCHVIDIGAGTGIFSLLACKYGAAHVTAIEPAAAVLLLKETARANGFEDRITILKGLSTDYRPERKADVIVSDIRGILPLFEHHIATIVDARERLLAPGGTLIPMRDTLHCALVHAPVQERRITVPWLRNDYDLDLSAGHRYAANTYDKTFLQPDALVSRTELLATLDYRTITASDLSAAVTLRPTSTPVVTHGLLLWFDAELAPGIGFSNAPGQPRLVYAQSYLPFAEPLTLASDDRVEASLKAVLVEGNYVWSWIIRHFRGEGATPVQTLRQSTLQARPLAHAQLARTTAQHVPAATGHHALDARILSLVDGVRPLREIADTVQAEYPAILGDAKAALDRVAGLLKRYHTG